MLFYEVARVVLGGWRELRRGPVEVAGDEKISLPRYGCRHCLEDLVDVAHLSAHGGVALERGVVGPEQEVEAHLAVRRDGLEAPERRLAAEEVGTGAVGAPVVVQVVS